MKFFVATFILSPWMLLYAFEQKEHKEPIAMKNIECLLLQGADESVFRGEVDGFAYRDLELPEEPEDVAKYLKPFYLNREMTFEDLVDLKIEVGKYFYQHGRPFIRVSIPEQEVVNGVLRLKVVESRIGTIQVVGNKHFSSKQFLKYLKAKPGDHLRERPMGHDLYSMNINPFHQVDLLYSPGSQPDQTDVTLQVWDRRPWRIYSGFDNTGIPGTGRVRWLTGFEAGNMFFSDHVLNYQYTSSLDFHKFQAHTLQYLVPFSVGHTLNLYGGYAEVHAHLEFPGGRNTGRSYQASVRYDVPMVSDQFLRFQSQFGFDFKRTNSAIFFQEVVLSEPVTPFLFTKNVNLTQFTYGIQLLYQTNRHNIEWITNGFWSPGKWVSDQSDRDYESIRPGAKNHWVYAITEFVYEYKAPSEILLHFRWIGQISSQNLLPSEQLPLGGYNSVRGYDERQENKDSGVLARMEIRSPLWPFFWRTPENRFQILGFIDYGWGVDRTPYPEQPRVDWMLGVGPGIRYTYSPYITGRFDWGFKLHSKPFYTGGSSEGHFSVIGSF